MKNLHEALEWASSSLSPTVLDLFSMWEKFEEEYGDPAYWKDRIPNFFEEYFQSGFRNDGFYHCGEFAEIYFWAKTKQLSLKDYDCIGDFEVKELKPAMIACIGRFAMGHKFTKVGTEASDFHLQQYLNEIEFLHQQSLRKNEWNNILGLHETKEDLD